jgi:hypothetical protein
VRQGSGGRAVVAVRMGDEDGLDRAAGDGGFERLDVGGIGRAGIENGKPVSPIRCTQVPRRVGRRVGCEQAGEAGPERLEEAGPGAISSRGALKAEPLHKAARPSRPSPRRRRARRLRRARAAG